jgi:succinate-acetate transporter protein
MAFFWVGAGTGVTFASTVLVGLGSFWLFLVFLFGHLKRRLQRQQFGSANEFL